MLADINEPNVVVHLDTYHMNIEETSMADAVATCGDKLGCAVPCCAMHAQETYVYGNTLRYMHIGESHRGYLGTGSVDFDGLFKALVAAKYTVRGVGF